MVTAEKIIIVLALCLYLIVSPCYPTEPPILEPLKESVLQTNTPSPMSEKDIEDNAEAIEMYDLVFSIPAELEVQRLSGAEQSVYVGFERDDSGSDVSWMTASPHRPGLVDTTTFPPTTTDESGVPVLTTESVTEQYSWKTEVRTVFDEGTLIVGGMPAAYIEVALFSERWPDETWRVRLTRTVYDGIAYDFLYASFPDLFDKHLPAAEGIIASARFASEDPVKELSFWDITMSYPTSGVKATVSEEQILLSNSHYRGNALHFYARHDDTVLYTDALLDDSFHLDRLLRIWSYSMVDQRFRKYREPREVLRKEVEINGRRALRVVYHDDWEYNQYDEYMDLLLFVHNYDLYILQGKGEVGHEDALLSFTQPIIGSIRFDKILTEPPSGRPMPYSRTVQWMTNTYAIVTIQNGADTDLVGAFLPTEENAKGMRLGLSRNWGIIDRESSDQVIGSLYRKGHRAQFQEFVKEIPILALEQDEFEIAIKELPDELTELRYICENTREAYRLHGDKAILAWDYCRIIYLYCSGYIAGYYTYSEALDLSLPIALELQGLYSSWGDMYRDYMAGFHFWSPGDVNDPSTENYARTQIMLNLEASHDEPDSLPWDTELVNDWYAVPRNQSY